MRNDDPLVTGRCLSNRGLVYDHPAVKRRAFAGHCAWGREPGLTGLTVSLRRSQGCDCPGWCACTCAAAGLCCSAYPLTDPLRDCCCLLKWGGGVAPLSAAAFTDVSCSKGCWGLLLSAGDKESGKFSEDGTDEF